MGLAEPGDALLHHPKTVHGSPANHSTRPVVPSQPYSPATKSSGIHGPATASTTSSKSAADRSLR
ncbi:phytanoyl-CoA dioxygenase family protein [Rhodococcus sp. WS7]|uniref:phytanoyl-CoA dioxygenase family protein n=1 Tax=unclassified Rhodococcus (in: high G+C Gram-positive bacteria) TaxID=192944 RepID=UPI0034D97F2D